MTNPPLLKTTFIRWLPLAVGLGIFAMATYVAVQQDLRMSANQPQMQLAEDTARQIDTVVVTKGDTTAKELVGSTLVPISPNGSLAPWLTIVDGQGNIEASSMLLDGTRAIPPVGTLTAAKKQGQNVFSWQPEPGVRQAVVIQYVRPLETLVSMPGNHARYVITGRSLREVEKQETWTERTIGGALLGALVVTFILTILGVAWERRSSALN